MSVPTTYHWGANNRLREVQQGDTRTRYYYDALGRRIAKTHYATAHGAPEHTYYGWNGNQLALELTAEEKVHYLYLGDGFEPVAQERTWLRPPSTWTGGPLDPNHPEYSSIFRSNTPNPNGTFNQFRIENSSLMGNHDPFKPHGHLQVIKPGNKGTRRGKDKDIVNNHIIFKD